MTRVMQFTDLHFRQALPGHSGHAERLSRHGPALLSALAERVAAEKPDIVAFTGDIIDAPHDLLHGTAEPPLERILQDAVRADYRTMRRWLDDLGRPFMITPGNHDFQPLFEEVFGDTPRRIALGDVTLHAYQDWEVRDNTAERLDAELRRFDDALASSDRPAWTVHLQHFLIWPDAPHGYPMRYREADWLRDRLAGAETPQLVLCGHFHKGTGFVDLGLARFAVCPSMAEPPHRYRIIDLGPGTAVLRDVQIAAGPMDGRKILLIDRSDYLTFPENAADGRFVLRPEAPRIFEMARAAGFWPVVVSIWNDDQSVSLTWGELLKKHDHMHFALAQAGNDQGEGLVIAMDDRRALPARMPSEAIVRLDRLTDDIAARLGVVAESLWRLKATELSEPTGPRVLRGVEALAALQAAEA